MTRREKVEVDARFLKSSRDGMEFKLLIQVSSAPPTPWRFAACTVSRCGGEVVTDPRNDLFRLANIVLVTCVAAVNASIAPMEVSGGST